MKKYLLLMLVIVGSVSLTAMDCHEEGRMDLKKMHHFSQEECNQPPGNRHQQREDSFLMLQELELSSNQQTELENLRLENQKSMIRADSEIDIMEIDLKKAFRDREFDKARDMTRRIAEKRLEMALQKISFQEQRWQLLTTEQKEKLLEMRKHHESPRLEKMHK
ncbi:MAG: hypothetical protein JW784_04365 [Candidatus Cloacimonetes bacterium]|nr:hypothetical protein [Candidatus Cloacimonadota bacterium]